MGPGTTTPRALRIVLLLALLAALTPALRPAAVGAQGDDETPLDLAAMALTPTDVAGAGLGDDFTIYGSNIGTAAD